jgi:hypothetical protein
MKNSDGLKRIYIEFTMGFAISESGLQTVCIRG